MRFFVCVCVCVVWCVVNRVRSQGFSWRNKAWLLILFPWNIYWQIAVCWSTIHSIFHSVLVLQTYSAHCHFWICTFFKIWRPWIAVLAILACVVQWRYKDWNRPQIPWHFTGYSLTLLEFSLAYLNQTNSVPKTIIYTCIFLVSKKNAILSRINQIIFFQKYSLYCETVSNFMTVIPTFSYERPYAASLSFDIILIIMTDLATA